MSSQIQFPGPLPIRITPCPIVEAVFETRFVSTEPWPTLPGLLYGQIRDRYREQISLPLQQVPEQVRAQDPAFTHLPLLQFKGESFLVQLGPRVLSLVTKPRLYPGWGAIRAELGWLLPRVAQSGFLRETERIGVRYIDFFSGDIFPICASACIIDGAPLKENQTDVTTVMRLGKVGARLQITNGAIVASASAPEVGSVLDLDTWVGPADADLFGKGLDWFTELHETGKRVFFGLLKPEFLNQLQPVYP